jgi:hypothetical protein
MKGRHFDFKRLQNQEIMFPTQVDRTRMRLQKWAADIRLHFGSESALALLLQFLESGRDEGLQDTDKLGLEFPDKGTEPREGNLNFCPRP